MYLKKNNFLENIENLKKQKSLKEIKIKKN